MPPEARLRIGCVVEAEAVVGERVADPGRGRLVGGAACACGLAGIAEERDLVAALLLGPVHRLVGGDQDRLGAAGVLAAEHRDPDADRHRVRPPAPAGRSRRPAARRSSPSCSAPSVSVCGISTANSSPERRATMSVARTRSRRIVGDLPDQVVAGVVAEAVVDRLEAVDVDDHHRALAAVAGAEGDVAGRARRGSGGGRAGRSASRGRRGSAARPRSSRPAASAPRTTSRSVGSSFSRTASMRRLALPSEVAPQCIRATVQVVAGSAMPIERPNFGDPVPLSADPRPTKVG